MKLEPKQMTYTLPDDVGSVVGVFVAGKQLAHLSAYDFNTLCEKKGTVYGVPAFFACIPVREGWDMLHVFPIPDAAMHARVVYVPHMKEI